MKNLKVNEKLMTIIVTGGISLVTMAVGFGLGRTVSKSDTSKIVNETVADSNDTKNVVNGEIINEYLTEYIDKRAALEEDIETLSARKEELQKKNSRDIKSFDMRNLIVIEHENADNENNLYILDSKGSGPSYNEYHAIFRAWYGLHLHPETDEHTRGCSDYVYFDEFRPLADYLTEAEIYNVELNDGWVTNLELDEILNRIRKEFQEKNTSKAKSLTSN